MLELLLYRLGGAVHARRNAGRIFAVIADTMNQSESSFAIAAAAVQAPAWVRHAGLVAWVRQFAERERHPDRIVWCDGSREEYERLCDAMVAGGTLMRLDRRSALAVSWRGPIRPTWRGSRTAPSSAANARTMPGPTNNWVAPREMRATLDALFDGCMRGRTLYVVPFSMGPLGSPIAHIGVELTDSPYVAASMGIMTRMGRGGR